MKELSLNILDIAQNSVKAGAKDIDIRLTETADTLTIEITDDGCGMAPEDAGVAFLRHACGMDAEAVKGVIDPFFTTRTTRNVGLGVPLLKLAAEQTGGGIEISSVSERDDPRRHGTRVTANFNKNNIDFTPLGDIVSTVTALIQGAPGIEWRFIHEPARSNWTHGSFAKCSAMCRSTTSRS